MGLSYAVVPQTLGAGPLRPHVDPLFADRLEFDWTPLTPSLSVGYDLSGHGRHLTSFGTGVVWNAADARHRGRPTWDHTVSGPYFEHPAIPSFDFSSTSVWSIGVQYLLTNTTLDERTIFSVRDTTTAAIQLLVRTGIGGPPTRMEVFYPTQVAGTLVVTTNAVQTFYMRCFGSGGVGGWDWCIYDADGVLLEQVLSPGTSAPQNPTNPIWLCASFVGTNDPFLGTLAGVRGWSRILSDQEITAYALDWHWPYRLQAPWDRDAEFVPPTFEPAWGRRPRAIGAGTGV